MSSNPSRNGSEGRSSSHRELRGQRDETQKLRSWYWAMRNRDCKPTLEERRVESVRKEKELREKEEREQRQREDAERERGHTAGDSSVQSSQRNVPNAKWWLSLEAEDIKTPRDRHRVLKKFLSQGLKSSELKNTEIRLAENSDAPRQSGEVVPNVEDRKVMLTFRIRKERREMEGDEGNVEESVAENDEPAGGDIMVGAENDDGSISSPVPPHSTETDAAFISTSNVQSGVDREIEAVLDISDAPQPAGPHALGLGDEEMIVSTSEDARQSGEVVPNVEDRKVMLTFRIRKERREMEGDEGNVEESVAENDEPAGGDNIVGAENDDGAISRSVREEEMIVDHAVHGNQDLELVHLHLVRRLPCTVRDEGSFSAFQTMLRDEPEILFFADGFVYEVRSQRSEADEMREQRLSDNLRHSSDCLRYALGREIAASVVKEIFESQDRSRESETPYEFLASKYSDEGAMIQLFRVKKISLRFIRIGKWDCVLRRLQSGEVDCLVCFTGRTISLPNGENVIAFVLLHRFPGHEISFRTVKELASFTSIRNDMLQYSSINIMEKPRGKLQTTMAALIKFDGELLNPWRERLQRSLTRWECIDQDNALQTSLGWGEYFLQENCDSMAMWYMEEALERDLLNPRQFGVIRRAMTLNLMWLNRDAGESELIRFYGVFGVPGCGKTYTLVYLLVAFLLQHAPSFRMSGANAEAQILVLTETNKALDVICDRMQGAILPRSRYDKALVRGRVPYMCSRSMAYRRKLGPGMEHRAGNSNPAREPVLMSTFGNLPNLLKDLEECVARSAEPMDVQDFVRRKLKAVVFDEGSQSGLLRLSLFVHLFPTFDGSIIIFGDPRQQDPVVLSGSTEVRKHLSVSILSRVYDRYGAPLIVRDTLREQYRMHPEIMDLANRVAYENTMIYGLKDGKEAKHLKVPRVYCGRSSEVPVSPLAVVSVNPTLGREFWCHNYVNWGELHVAIAYIDILCYQAGIAEPEDIAFLSPYNQQCRAMTWLCSRDVLNIPITVRTVTVFQGEESKFVIFSSVRTGGGAGGLATEDKLVTTAITRAVNGLIIIGDQEHLASTSDAGNIWCDLQQEFEDLKIPRVQPRNLYDEGGELHRRASMVIRREVRSIER